MAEIPERYTKEHMHAYHERVARFTQRHPEVKLPSVDRRDILCISMYLRDYRDGMRVAAELGDIKMLEYMCREKLVGRDWQNNRDIINVEGRREKETPLFCAIERKRLGAAEWLLQRGAKIVPTKGGWNAVCEACRQGSIPALNLLKRYGVDFNQGYPAPIKSKKYFGLFPEKFMLYPLTVAIADQKTEVIRWLIDNGVSIDTPLIPGCTARDLAESPILNAEIRQILQQAAARSSFNKMTEENKNALQSRSDDLNQSAKRISFWKGMFAKE